MAKNLTKRGERWRARRMIGGKTYTRTFDTRDQARQWLKAIEPHATKDRLARLWGRHG